MFCSECGGRLTSGEIKCRSCGAPAEGVQSCGGFWGLTGEQPPAPVQKPPAPAPRPQTRPAAPAPQRQQLLWPCLCAALLVLLLVQTLAMFSLNRRLADLEEDLLRYLSSGQYSWVQEQEGEPQGTPEPEQTPSEAWELPEAQEGPESDTKASNGE